MPTQMAEQNYNTRDLKDELASLRIDREKPPRQYGRVVLVLLLLVAVAGGALYFVRANPTFGATEVETVQASVVSNSGPDAGTPILTASGYLVARRQAVVSAKVQGRISELRVEEGSFVREGDILARLESADYAAAIVKSKADIEYAEANLAEAQRQFRLQEGLYREKVVSQDALDSARSKVQLSRAALDQDKANLQVQEALFDFTYVRAPFTGVVVKKMADIGESVTPIPPGVNLSTSSGAIVSMADMNSLEAEVDVNESNVAQLKKGQPAEISVQAFADRKYRGSLRQVIPTADRTKATVTVRVAILNKDKDIKPEMSCNVTFLEPAKDQAKKSAAPQRIVTIPKDAIATRDGKPVVFEVESNKVRLHPVVTGADLEGGVIVKQGLAGSETLVNNPPQKLRDGETVKVKS